MKIKIEQKAQESWVSATDLMSGLMLIFMFIAVVFMRNVSQERDSMKKIAQEWAETKDTIYQALYAQFEDSLKSWQAEIEPDSLIVRFREPKVLFEEGSTKLTPRFINILNSFFPRYLNVLNEFAESISEIRIEGHTSSEWGPKTPPEESYFLNMKLSQGRTREVLEYCLSLKQIGSLYTWGQKVIIAAGMSSSRLVRRNGDEDKEASRRVEFRVRTNADERLSLILSPHIGDSSNTEILNKNHSKASYNLLTSLKDSGREYFRRHNYQLAIRNFTQALEINRNDDWTLSYLAECYRLIKDYSAALEKANTAIRINPKRAFSFRVRGHIHYNENRFSEAISDFDKALQLEPENDWTLPYLAECYRMIKDYNTALEKANKAIKINKKRAFSFKIRGLIYYDQQKYVEARNDFTAALKLEPEDDWTLRMIQACESEK